MSLFDTIVKLFSLWFFPFEVTNNRPIEEKLFVRIMIGIPWVLLTALFFLPLIGLVMVVDMLYEIITGD